MSWRFCWPQPFSARKTLSVGNTVPSLCSHPWLSFLGRFYQWWGLPWTIQPIDVSWDSTQGVGLGKSRIVCKEEWRLIQMCSLILFLSEAASVQLMGNIFYFISLIKQRNIPDTQEDVVNIISSYLGTTFENLCFVCCFFVCLLFFGVFLEIMGTQTSVILWETTGASQVSASQAGMYIPPEAPENMLGILDATVLLEIRSRCSQFLSSVKSCLMCMQEQKQKPKWGKHLHSKWKSAAFVVWGYGVLLILWKCHPEQDETLQH